MKTLITSFGPFGPFASNPSHQLMQMLQDDQQFSSSFNIDYEVLEVSYQAVDEWVGQERVLNHDLILHLGVATGAEKLRFETLARNKVQGKDVRGVEMNSAILSPYGDDLASTFPSHLLQEILSGYPDEATLSDDAGAYLCNYLYYRSLAKMGQQTAVLFIHVADVQQVSDAVPLQKQAEIVKQVVRLFALDMASTA